MTVFFVNDAKAQLTIDEGTINARFTGFKRNCGWGDATFKPYLLIRSQFDKKPSSFNCFRLHTPNQYQYYTLNDYAGNFIFTKSKEKFHLYFDGEWGKNANTDANNCNDGVKNGTSKMEYPLPPETYTYITELNFNSSNKVTKTFVAEGCYEVTYEFTLAPKNTFNFKLSTTENGIPDLYTRLNLADNDSGPSANRSLCLDEKIKIELHEQSQSTGINVAKIIYEYNFNNEQIVVGQIDNPDYCGDPEDPDRNPMCDDSIGSSIPCCQEKVDVYGPKYVPLISVLASDNYLAEGIELTDKIPDLLDAFDPNDLDQTINFRIRSKLVLENGQETNWKESSIYNIHLGFPDMNSSPVSIIPACNGQSNGEITFQAKNPLNGTSLENLDAMYNLAFFLVDTEANADIGIATENVVFNNNEVTIKKIPKGKYQLEISYAGITSPCSSTLSFDMPELPPLALATDNPITAINPVCFNGQGAAMVKLKAIAGMTNVAFTLGGQAVDYTALPDESVGGEVLKVFRLNNLPVGENQVVDISADQIRAGADNCVLQIQSPMISIVAPDRVTANEPTINPSACNIGYNAGVVLQNLKGGSGNYLISVLDNQGNEVSRYESTTDEGTVQVAGAGNYKVKVNDLNAQSCDGTTFDIVLNPVESLSLTAISTVDNACAGVSEGRITGKFEGTDEGIVSLYDDSGTLIGEQPNSVWNFSDLAAGSYEVKLKRSATCNDETTQIVEIKEPKAFDISLGDTPISCDGASDGILTATVDNFGIDYVTKWYKDGVPLAATDLTISNLGPGNYTLEITPVTLSGTQCAPYEKHYEITEPTTVTAEVLSDAINCLDPPNNDLLIDNLSGGSSQFNIEIYKDGNLIITENNYTANSLLAENIDPGSYDVKIFDAQRPTCGGFENSFTIAPLEPLDLTVNVIRHNNCYGDNQGKIGINWKGNRAIFQILDADKNIIVETTLEDNVAFEIDTLLAGTYETVLLRSPGCNEKEVQSVTITEPANMSFDFTKIDIACFGLETGEINGTLTGGTGNYQWEWFKDGSTMNISGTGSDIALKSITDGDYSIHITDENSCAYQFEVAIVPLSDPMEVDLITQDISCLGEADGWINASVIGGTQPFQYSWSNDQGALADIDNRLEVSTPGNYFLAITDNLGCQTFDTLFVYEPPGIDFPDNINLCKEDQFRAVLSYPENDVVYSWTANNGFSSSDSVVMLNTTGDYTASVTRPNGCRYEHTFTVKMLDVEFMASFLGASWVEVGDTVYLKEVSRPKPDSITWDFPEGLLVDYDSLGDPYIYADTPGDYTIGMYGYKDSCMSYVSKVFTYSEKGEAPKLVDEDIFGPKGIAEYKVYPNPTDGNFEIEIKLFNKEEAAVFLYDVNGDEKWRARGEDNDEYNFSPHLTNLQPGVHILMLVTPSSRETIKVIVQ